MPDYDRLISIKIIVLLNGYPDVYISIVSYTYAGLSKYNSAISQMEQYIAGFEIIENYNKLNSESKCASVDSSDDRSITKESTQSDSVASQIREIKPLIEDGIITKEEFQQKKASFWDFN